MIRGIIEPIKEEIEIKLNSPSNQKLNTSGMKNEKLNIQENYTIINSRKNRTRNVKKINEKERIYNQQINNNSIFNNYIKNANIGSNTKDKEENGNIGDKVFINYYKRKNEDVDNNNNINNNVEEENKKIDDIIINSKRSFIGTCRQRIKIVNNRDKEKLLNNIDITTNIKNNKKEKEIE